MEVHEDPDKALCDGPNSIPLNELPGLLKILKTLDFVIKQRPA
jgi:2-dehydro-3-deoxyphosphooctonate aldolase (KDO 8-P synthase)